MTITSSVGLLFFLAVPLLQYSLNLSYQLFFIRHIQDIARSKNVICQTAQSIFCCDAVLVSTEDNADGEIVIRVIDFRCIVVEDTY